MAGTERIEPGVKFKPALVRLRNGESQWIVCRLRRLAHTAGQVLRPRFQVRRVKGIGGWTYLKDDGVEAQGHSLIEQRAQFGLLLRRWKRWPRGPIDVGNGRDPDPAKLAWHEGRR